MARDRLMHLFAVGLTLCIRRQQDIICSNNASGEAYKNSGPSGDGLRLVCVTDEDNMSCDVPRLYR